jgi:DNA repair protein RadC
MKSDRIKNWPARERPRERLIAEGPERLTDAELLAIVLRVGRGTFKAGVSGQSATELARQLLADFKGWRGLDRAFTRDLMKVQWIGDGEGWSDQARRPVEQVEAHGQVCPILALSLLGLCN